MTEKQRSVLEAVLTNDRINKLDENGFKQVSNFIDLVIHFRHFDRQIKGYYNNVPFLKRNPTAKERKEIEGRVNKDRERLGLVKDEYASIKEVRYFYGGEKWIILDQSWFKGESNTPTHSYRAVNADGTELFDGVFNVLFDMGIYSVNDFIEYLNNSLQDELDKKTS